MKKFAALAALVAVSAAIAAPASAATLVRVSLANKSDVQINSEILAAAEKVCSAEKISVQECINTSVRDANRQRAAIIKARSSTKAAGRQDAVTLVRLSLKGKSNDQILTEIKAAAEMVCKASKDSTNRSDYQACVGGTVRAAKAQLQAMSNRSSTNA